ncbi:jg3523 [Pararge aegeria aegeria]|uniref:Jg3523 protein n=1 Tax=Pararge aegeria aegeria TaxID=348720 RepID=A0A8S4QU31_9NEOP|nr:jg3523 [Pararge aegeria aegeria]
MAHREVASTDSGPEEGVGPALVRGRPSLLFPLCLCGAGWPRARMNFLMAAWRRWLGAERQWAPLSDERSGSNNDK